MKLKKYYIKNNIPHRKLAKNQKDKIYLFLFRIIPYKYLGTKKLPLWETVFAFINLKLF